jgi:hypothetical protein
MAIAESNSISGSGRWRKTDLDLGSCVALRAILAFHDAIQQQGDSACAGDGRDGDAKPSARGVAPHLDPRGLNRAEKL